MPYRYSVHPGVLMVQKWIETLPEKTGRSLEEWVRLVKKEGPLAEKERREWLETKHKPGANAAWWIAERAEGKGAEDGDPDAYLRRIEIAALRDIDDEVERWLRKAYELDA